ncbi:MULTISPECIES: hypothetical protein [unclassified Agrococcus]|uniref:hypothetical protein n=1 Tax=unclassified Agrococcus TaxID=2615065 RepID=UPI00361124F4
MHFPIGLLAIAVAISIAAWRTRPRWWMWAVGALVAIGLVWSVLSIVGVTVTLGGIVAATIGWVYLGLCLTVMLAAVFVLERRGPNGEEAPPLIGDNPLDGDTDDRDDPAPSPHLP